MESEQKKVLRPLCLELRHLLEGYYDSDGAWHAGDLEQRLASLGVWWERDPIPVERLTHLPTEDLRARELIDAFLELRAEAGVERRQAVEEFVRETAYTWATRLLLLRCMEARGLIDEVVVAKTVYGGRSLVQMRLCQAQPALCTGEDGGLFAMFTAVFVEQARRLPEVFDPMAPGVVLRPSTAALQRCIALLSGTAPVNGKLIADDAVFSAPDALGWAYQYWNGEEKDRVFERVRTVKGSKITGADIVPATQLYTEPYMVKFLVQNSLGAYWQQMHPESNLADGWDYYVRDADRAPVKAKNVESMTFLDPACGSGHFLIEAFDLFYQMYVDEGKVTDPELICRRILEKNLFGIDIDERAVQIARAALWMKAAERVPGFRFAPKNLIATNLRLPPGKDHLEAFLSAHPEDAPLAPALATIFEGLAHADELGSLLQIEEPVRRVFSSLKGARQTTFGDHGGDDDTWFTPPGTLEDWGVWQVGVVERLADHFAAEAERATPAEAFFSRSAGQALRLFDLLSQRYDVVATNPPFMGSTNMGPTIKKYVETHYPQGKRDLYAAFILRNLQFAKSGGKVAMVTQQSWMFLRSFAALRAMDEEALAMAPKGAFTGILRETSLEVLAHLGEHAFVDTAAAGAFVALFTLGNVVPKEGHQLTTFRLVGLNNAMDKKTALSSRSQQYKFNNKYFLKINNSPLIYWLTQGCLDALTCQSILYDIADVRQGMATTDNPRFLRFFWEIPASEKRWVPYAKGGGYKKWAGYGAERVDWNYKGDRLKAAVESIADQHWSRRLASHDRYFQPGLTYTLMARGSMGCRRLEEGHIFDVASMCIFSNDQQSINWLLPILNTHFSSYLLRAVTQDIKFHSGYVGNFPIPQQVPTILCEEIGSGCIKLKECIERKDLTYQDHLLDGIRKGTGRSREGLIALTSYLHLLEGYCEIITHEAFSLKDKDISSIFSETGTPASFFPLITGYDTLPPYPDDLPSLPAEVIDYLAGHERIAPSPDELIRIRTHIRQLYEAGPGVTVEAEEEPAVGDADKETVVIGSRIPIPPETFLEEISQKMEIHPITIYHLLQEGIEQEGWRCLPEERRMLADRYTVLALRLLGHRWPKQVEAGEPVPAWADTDGIIPLVAGSAESTLLDRVRERLVADGEDLPESERYFEEVMGQSLEEWLAIAFFKHHVRQFKKRPVAWQLQSGPFTRRKTPAFACLVYCQAVDGDILHKVRSRYVGELRKRCETELRDIEGLPLRTEAQDRRARELTDRLAELKAFDAKLADVAERGFASKTLEQIAKKEPLDHWCSPDGVRPAPATPEAFLQQEQAYVPDINDGVRVNIVPLQKAGLLASDVIAKKDLEKAISDRAEWRADERRWCREGKLPKCGWW